MEDYVSIDGSAPRNASPLLASWKRWKTNFDLWFLKLINYEADNFFTGVDGSP